LSSTRIAATICESPARDQQAAKKENNMKKPKAKKETMLAEYDFSSGTKGKYAKLYKQGTNLILLEPDIAEAFPDSKSVNDSLRALASIIQVRSKALAAN
jgi:hypothetical protein